MSNDPERLETPYTTSSFSKVELHKESDSEYLKPLTKIEDNRSLKPTVQELTVDAPVTPEKIALKLEAYGGCIVKEFLDVNICDKILEEVYPHFDFDKKWEGEFFPLETKRVPSTMIKSKTAAENFLIHPLINAVSKRFLGKENLFYIGKEMVRAYSPPQLNACVTFSIAPGAKDQDLHRDDMLHHNIRHYQDKYEYGTETAVGTALALSRTTKANGATRFIPGSHLWDHFRAPTEDDVIYAELEKGDAFFMLASCFHGGSANTTVDEYRLQSIMFMTQGTLRQEENIFLETPLDYFKSLTPGALAALGLVTSEPYCGWVRDLVNPITILKPEIKKNKDDDYSKVYKVKA